MQIGAWMAFVPLVNVALAAIARKVRPLEMPPGRLVNSGPGLLVNMTVTPFSPAHLHLYHLYHTYCLFSFVGGGERGMGPLCTARGAKDGRAAT